MKKNLLLILLMGIIIIFGSCSQADVLEGRPILPAWAKLAFYLNVKEIVNIDLLKSKLKDETADQRSLEILNILNDVGINIYEDVHSIKGASADISYSQSSVPQKYILYISLDYEYENIKQYMENELQDIEIKNYKIDSIPITEVYYMGTHYGFIFMKNMIILCNPEGIEEAIDLTHGDGMEISENEEISSIIEILNNYTLGWLVLELSSDFKNALSQNLAQNFLLQGLKEDITNLQYIKVGASSQEGFELFVAIETNSEQIAEKLTAKISGFWSLLGKPLISSIEGMGEIANAIEFSTQGVSMVITLNINQEQLDRIEQILEEAEVPSPRTNQESSQNSSTSELLLQPYAQQN